MISKRSLPFLLCLLLAGGGAVWALPAAASAGDEDSPPSPGFLSPHQRFPVLSYNEFMRLTPAAQEDYILVMRDFVVELEKIAPSGFPETAHSRWEMFLHFLRPETLPEAQADTGRTCELRTVVQGGLRNLQLYCVGKNGLSDTIQVSTGTSGSPDQLAQQLLSKMQDPEYTGPKVTMSPQQLAGQIRTYQDEGYDGTQSFQAPVKSPENRVVKVISTPAHSTPVVVDLPSDTKIEKPSPAEPLQTIKRTNAEGEVVESASNARTDLDKVGAGQSNDITDISARRRAPSAREAEDASMDKLKKIEEDHKAPLRCIYAGFPVKKTPESDACAPVESFLSEKSKRVFACKAENVSEAHKTAGGEVIVPKKLPGGKVVLCNPLVFGLDKDGAPFCVPRNSKATESCRFVSGKSSQKEASLKSAIELARENPLALSRIRWTYERLCQGSDADIQSLLGSQSDAQLKKSKADLAQTCAAYEQKLAEFPNGGRLGGSAGGQK